MFEVSRPLVFRNPVTGQTFHMQRVTRKPEKLAFRKKQTVIATVVVKPATFTDREEVKTEIYHDDFMSVICKVQEKYPGKKVSYKTL